MATPDNQPRNANQQQDNIHGGILPSRPKGLSRVSAVSEEEEKARTEQENRDLRKIYWWRDGRGKGEGDDDSGSKPSYSSKGGRRRRRY
jgi:hypothetical protein